ncbi:NAD(P)/FAD-dependent oxidoreductase [Bradyrhizobium jicamae]|uniref:NAD(P)/FAD-dependent oxidoreductase n=1 Tax=Bradyrhizobium jicamae TaxID=280332 RepID=A0ABS5FYE1_9BRAD|nr:NAD(P)/FAD-dependent oxidoreductase [Bradyrhizobium jicamae]MBR0801823.1 NAD(P)/FAD-dependent oxidoreductase [Bradyrhizobium jicamae]
MPATATYDTAIVGGGPAGVTTAIGLARAGARVLLLERSPRPVDKPGEIIASSARPLLAGLGLQDTLSTLRAHTLAGRFTCWHDAVGSDVASILDPHGGGMVVHRGEFEAKLLKAARAAGVSLSCGSHLSEVVRQSGAWNIEFRDDAHNSGQIHSARVPLIVEASGRAAGVLGHGHRHRSDRLVALITIGPARDGLHDQRLFIEATEGGWWYGFLLPDGTAVVAMLTSALLLPEGAARRRSVWTADLQSTRHVKALISGRTVGAFRGVAADSSIRSQLSGDAWVAVGDAAAAYDPITGSGVAAAISKGAALARLLINRPQSAAIAEYVAAERDVFATYESHRRNIYREAAGRFSSAFWNQWK